MNSLVYLMTSSEVRRLALDSEEPAEGTGEGVSARQNASKEPRWEGRSRASDGGAAIARSGAHLRAGTHGEAAEPAGTGGAGTAGAEGHAGNPGAQRDGFHRGRGKLAAESFRSSRGGAVVSKP